MSLIDLYGMEAVKKGKKRYYSPELKQDMIDKILLEGRLLRSVSFNSIVFFRLLMINLSPSPCSMETLPLLIVNDN